MALRLTSHTHGGAPRTRRVRWHDPIVSVPLPDVLEQSRGYYTYWRDLPVAGIQTVARPDRGWGAIPTNDGLTLVVGWTAAEARAYRTDIEGNYPAHPRLVPEWGERVREATRG